MKTEDAMKELDEKIKKVSEAGTWDGIDVDEYLNEIYKRVLEKYEADNKG